MRGFQAKHIAPAPVMAHTNLPDQPAPRRAMRISEISWQTRPRGRRNLPGFIPAMNNGGADNETH